MTLEQVIRLTELISIILIVLGFGLRSSVHDATYLFRNARLLLRSLLAMNLLMPLFAASIVAVFAFRPAIALALIALALSPVPPFLPGDQLKLVARHQYIFGLFGASALLVIVLAPLTWALIAALFAQHAGIAPLAIAKMTALTVLVPFSLGMFARPRMPRLAERASALSGKTGTVLLITSLVPVLIKQSAAMISLIGNGTVIGFVAFSVVGLAAGHLLGGPDAEDRTVLALATPSRHPGVALTIATEVYSDQKFVAPALLLYLAVNAITSTPYAMWRARVHKRLLAEAHASYRSEKT